MPIGVTLLDLRRELRAETGTSLNPAQGTQAQGAMDLVLARQQRELWDAINWQHLKIWADMPVFKNQAIYDYPPEMGFDQVTRIWLATDVVRAELNNDLILSSSSWKPLAYGVSAPMMQLGPPQTGTPVRWRNVVTVDTAGAEPITNPVGQLELLPMPPTSNMMLRFEGQAPLSPLIADNDKCIIDSKAIVLFAAAEVLAVQKSEGAPIKLQKAQNYLRRLQQDQGADKRTNYNMGGNQRGGVDPDKGRRMVPYIDYMPG
jgi:hypothetical protein